MVAEISSSSAGSIPVALPSYALPGAERSRQVTLPGPKPLPSLEELREALDKLEGAASYFNRSIHFEVLEDTGDVVVQIVDKGTNEVIRSIPAEEAIALSQRINEFLGVFFDAVV